MAPRARGHLFFLATLALFLTLDLVSKSMAVSHLGHEGAEHELWPGVFKFRLVYNPGMMWGMAQGVPAIWWIAIRGSVLLALGWLYLGFERRSAFVQFAFGLVASGAVGNIWDNIFFVDPDGAHRGQVRDFLHFYWFEFPTFNVADSCICVGAPLLLFVLWNHDREKSRESEGDLGEAEGR